MKTFQLRYIMSILVAVTCTHVFAQDTATISGMVGDDKKQPLIAATVSVLQASDSALIATAITNEQGYYEVGGIRPGSYLLSITTVGYEPFFTNVFTLAPAERYDAKQVWLKPVSKQLGSVTVKANRPVLQVKADKTVFNVASSVSSTGSNAIELIQKMPGIQVDDKGKIMLKGKLGVRIYVDGRLIQLSGEDLAAYLKSINSNDIEAIEIITVPGARYDASGNAGIINIKLRKKTGLGTNSSVSVGFIQGITPKVNGAANINHRNSHLNVFANTSVNAGKSKMTTHSPRVLKGDTYDQRFDIVSDTRNYNAKAGIDWFINPRKTIGVVATGNISHDDWLSNSYTDIYLGSSNVYDKTLIALNNTPRKRSSLNANFNYRYSDSSGKELNTDIDYGLFRGRSNAYQPNYYERHGNPISAVITSNNMPTDIDIYSARIDAAFSLTKGKLGLGIKASYVTTRNSSDLFMLTNDEMVPVADRSFGFDYKENINAAYVSYQRSLSERWSLQAGLRTEQTNSRGVLTRRDGIEQADNDIKRSYLDFFPNATVTYTANEKNVLNLSYHRRIDRPVYQDLNPFELKVDELTQLKGNSFLLPQYTNTVELAHTWNNQLTTSLGFSRVSNFSAEIIDTLRNSTFNQQRNIATQRLVSLNSSINLTLTPYWKFFGSAWGNYQHFKGGTKSSKVDVQAYSFGVSMQHNFTMGKGFSAELTGWYNGPGVYGPVFTTKAMGALDLGVQKLLVEDRLSIRLGITDLLHTGRFWKGRSEFNGVVLNIRSVSETRTLRLSVNYNFGNRSIKSSRERETGLETEKNRIKTK